MKYFFRSLLCMLPVAIVLVANFAHAETLKKYVAGLHKDEPRFSDYPVEVKNFKATKAPDLSSNENAKYYRRLISEAIKQPADFAGKYVIATNGCGAGCQMNWILDKQNGKIIADPIETRNGLDYKVDSNLLVVNPYKDLENLDVKDLSSLWGDVSYYELKDGQLKLIKKIVLADANPPQFKVEMGN